MNKIVTSFIENLKALWRPLSGVAIGGILIVHGMIIPLYLLLCKNQFFSDLTGLAALITASGIPFGIREWGKLKGNSQ